MREIGSADPPRRVRGIYRRLELQFSNLGVDLPCQSRIRAHSRGVSSWGRTALRYSGVKNFVPNGTGRDMRPVPVFFCCVPGLSGFDVQVFPLCTRIPMRVHPQSEFSSPGAQASCLQKPMKMRIIRPDRRNTP